MYEKANIILNGKRPKIKNKMKMPSPLLYNTELEVLAKAIKQEKDTESIQIRNKKVKLSLFAANIKKIAQS